MAGRWKRWMLAGLMVGAVGCTRNQTQSPPVMPGLPPQTGGGVSQYFGGSQGFQPSAPPTASAMQPEMSMQRMPRPSGQSGFNPETEVALASTYIAAAMERQTTVERDTLLDTARQSLQRALQKDPKSREAHLELARLYTYTQDKEKAYAVLQQARSYHPRDHDLPYQQSRICVTFGDWEKGAEAINAALAIDPENRTYHKVAGLCLAQLNRWDQAQMALSKVMPEAHAMYFLGRIMIDQNQIERGKNQIEQAARLDPQYALATQFLNDYAQGRIQPTDGVQLVEFVQPANATPANQR